MPNHSFELKKVRGVDYLIRCGFPGTARIRPRHAMTSSILSVRSRSEVKGVELERLIAEGVTLIESRNAFEVMCDRGADLFETQIGSAWRPRADSKVSHVNMTAAMIDSEDFFPHAAMPRPRS